MNTFNLAHLMKRSQECLASLPADSRFRSILEDFHPLLSGDVAYDFRDEEPFYSDGPFGRLTAEDQVSLAVWICRRYLTETGFTKCEEEALECLNHWLALRSEDIVFDLMFHSDVVDYEALDGKFSDQIQCRMFLVSDSCELARCIQEQGTEKGGGGWIESCFFDIYHHYRERLGETQPWNTLFLAWLIERVELDKS